MESIEQHIEQDKQILSDPTTNPQMRRHVEGELKELEEYVQNHKKEISLSKRMKSLKLKTF